MAGLWSRYLRVLEKRPLLTMAGTTGFLGAAGDISSQMIVERKGGNYEPGRTVRFFLFGTIVLGPAMRYWYFFLDKIYKGSKLAPVKMVLTDQICFAPCILTIFLSGMSLLRGEDWKTIKMIVKRDFPSVLFSNYKLWPATQLINFYFVPLHHRVLFINFVAFGWNTYLAWVAERTR